MLGAIFAALDCAAALSIASLNVRNYLAVNRWEAGAFRFNYPKPEAEKAALRALLVELRPELLFLQEMGDVRYLNELRLDLRADGLDYPYGEVSLAEGSERSLAFLSMRPPLEVLFSDDEDAGHALRRGIQEVVVEEGGRRLRCVHVHLKSRWSDDRNDPESRQVRGPEFGALAIVLTRQLHYRGDAEALLVLGDFNTEPEDVMFDPLWQLGLKSLPLADRSGETWTYWHRKTDRTDRIDAALVPQEQIGWWQPVGLWPQDKAAMTGSDHRLLLFSFDPEQGYLKK